MSKYTTEVRFICEALAEYDTSQGYGKVSEIINNSWDKVFDFNFPIFDEAYRSVLCKKILMHYYTREIGLETVGLWKLKLETMMNEIMPYYNQMYQSTLLEWNPLIDADYTKSHEGENAGTSAEDTKHRGTINDIYSKDGTVNDDGTKGRDNTTWNTYSDTPQGALTNVANETYLTDARKITDDEDITTSLDREYEESGGTTRTFNNNEDVDREYNNTDEYVEHIVGKFPGRSYPSLIKEMRESFINVDMDVIDSLSSLFMKLW